MNNKKKLEDRLAQWPLWRLLLFWFIILVVRVGPAVAAFVVAIGYHMDSKNDFALVWLALTILLIPDFIRK